MHIDWAKTIASPQESFALEKFTYLLLSFGRSWPRTWPGQPPPRWRTIIVQDGALLCQHIRFRILLSITTTHRSATDLGCLVHKIPFGVQSFEQAFGKAHAFFPRQMPEAMPEALHCRLLLEIDPIGLVRNRRGPSGEARVLEEYGAGTITFKRP